MIPSSLHEVDSLAAPTTDGQVLVWPTSPLLKEMLLANRAATASSAIELCGMSVPLREPGVPICMAGHQPEFMHPGVWAKNVAARRAADEVGGRAVFVVVDSDVPNRFAIEWPVRSGDVWRTAHATVRSWRDWQSYEQIGADAAALMATELRRVPTRIGDGGTTLMEAFREAYASAAGDHVSRWIAGMRSAERSLGVESPDYVRVSDWFSWRNAAAPDSIKRRAALFTAHLVQNARAFAAAYNKALAEYRLRRGMQGRQHPIPDLAVEHDRIELPFWCVSSDSPRSRLWVTESGAGSVRLFAEQNEFGSLVIAAINADPVAAIGGVLDKFGLRPRALAQTMFARLFACDLFIHGIGGAKYDTVTDAIIRDFFRIEPPAFACVTATLRLPLHAYGVSLLERSDAKRAARDVRFNAPRYLDDRERAALASVIETRAAAIRESETLRDQNPAAHTRRHEVYRRILASNQQLQESFPSLATGAASRYFELERHAESDRIAESREWFFALHPTDRLKALADSVRRAVQPG